MWHCSLLEGILCRTSVDIGNKAFLQFLEIVLWINTDPCTSLLNTTLEKARKNSKVSRVKGLELAPTNRLSSGNVDSKLAYTSGDFRSSTYNGVEHSLDVSIRPDSPSLRGKPLLLQFSLIQFVGHKVSRISGQLRLGSVTLLFEVLSVYCSLEVGCILLSRNQFVLEIHIGPRVYK